MVATVKKSEQIKMVEEGKINASADNAKLRMACFEFNQGTSAGTAGSTADLVVLPALCRIIPTLSRITTSALGATLNIGLRAYTDVEGNAVVEDDDALANALAGDATSKNLNVEGYVDVDSRHSVTVFAKGTLPANATLKGYIAYLAD